MSDGALLPNANVAVPPGGPAPAVPRDPRTALGTPRGGGPGVGGEGRPQPHRRPQQGQQQPRIGRQRRSQRPPSKKREQQQPQQQQQHRPPGPTMHPPRLPPPRRDGPDTSLSLSLRRACASMGLVESPGGTRRRRTAVRDLGDMLRRWSDSLPNRAGAGADDGDDGSDGFRQPILLSFGSYRLRVHTPDADVDCLVLAPPHATREDFFGSWVDVLRNDGRVGQLQPVAGAYTPVIKFEMSGVKIDLLFARVGDPALAAAAVRRARERREEARGKKREERLRRREEAEAEAAGGEGGEEGLSGGKEVDECDDDVDVDDDMDDDREDEIEIEIDDSLLVGLDEASVRSVNGVRVAQFLMRAVGGEGGGGGAHDGAIESATKNDADLLRAENFRWTLRAVKEWARVHGLYSNVLGFLGGVNWAILVCWICKRNPEATPSTLLRLFFRTYATWKWPKPVCLSHTNQRPPKGVDPLPVWNPRDNYRDATHLMPIVTPCYPCMNSSYNVGEPQLRRMRDEFSRASRIVDDVFANEVNGAKKNWDALFTRNDFFRQHDHYLQINIVGSNEDQFRAWFGLCESRLRILIVGLESPQYGVCAYPFAELFHHRGEDAPPPGGGGDEPPSSAADAGDKDKRVASFFVALRFMYGINNVNLGPLVMDFLHAVNTWEGRVGGMDLTIHMVPRNRLPSFVFHRRDRLQRQKHDAGRADVVDGDVESTTRGTSTDGEQRAGVRSYAFAAGANADEAGRDGDEEEGDPLSCKKPKRHPDGDVGSATAAQLPTAFISPLKRTRISYQSIESKGDRNSSVATSKVQ